MYSSSGIPDLTYTCTETDCSNCVGDQYCSDFTLTVSTEGAVSDLSPVSDCKHGDTVKLESASGSFSVYEIAILEKPGNFCESQSCFLYVFNNKNYRDSGPFVYRGEFCQISRCRDKPESNAEFRGKKC